MRKANHWEGDQKASEGGTSLLLASCFQNDKSAATIHGGVACLEVCRSPSRSLSMKLHGDSP